MFGGGGGFGSSGFGQQNQNNQQQNSIFGQPAQPTTGFGTSTNAPGANPTHNPAGGFGQPAQQTQSAFGQPAQQSGGIFGQPQQQQQQQNTGFGRSPTSASQHSDTLQGGFGSTTPSAFGSQNKPTFGATGSSMFGGNTTQTSTGFGGFGSSNNTGSAFGSSNTGGGIFGQKPQSTGFGSNTATSGGIFGGGQQTSAFGSTGSAFGSSGGAGGGGGVITNGTSGTPFQTYQEKDPSSSSTNLYQTITCMPAYRNYSVEELRLQDYQQGRKQGTGTGAGGFGQSTGFGGTTATPFGQTSNTGFGSTNNTGSGMFGSSQPTTAFGQPVSSGFGSNTSSAFGQPSTSSGGGIFGQSQNTNTGGIFGSSNTSTVGFGQTSSAGTGFGGFGQANKPAAPTFGGFGSTNTSTPSTGFGTSSFGATSGATTGGFGTNTNTGGGLFGQSTAPASGGLFGQQQPQQQQQQQQQNSLFGGSSNTSAFGQPATSNANTGTGFGGFGATQNKPATPAFGGFGAATSTPAKPGGLFGTPATSTTGTGLFGQPAAPTSGIGGFGTSSNTSGGGGLFGSSQPSTGGLFGQNNTQTSAFGNNNSNTGGSAFGGGGGLFGNKPATGTTGGGLFGAPSAPAQQSSGLFGSSQPANTGGGLFGGSTMSSSIGGGLFGQSQPQQAQQMQPLTASVGENAYGNNPLFASSTSAPLGNSTNLPIAVPVNNPVRRKKAAMLPHHRLTPRSSSSYKLRGFSPAFFDQRGSPQLGTPPPPSRQTPESKNHLFDGTPKEDLLIEAAFKPKPSVKKLVINRKLDHGDLVRQNSSPASGRGSTPSQQLFKPKVQFNASLESIDRESSPAWDVFGRSNANNSNETPTKQTMTNGSNSAVSTPASARSKSFATSEKYQYWMSPDLSSLLAMNTAELKRVKDFTVGCNGFGQVHFDEPVDLTRLPCDLKDLCGNLVIFGERTCTVYKDGQNKPPLGQGLNVPATISLEGCFALDKATRAPLKDESHPRFRQFLNKIKNMKDTEFISYEKEDGHWRFRVPHFTKYGVDDSDDDDEMDMGQSTFVKGKRKTMPALSTRPLKDNASLKKDSAGDAQMTEDAPPPVSLFDEDLSGAETAAGRTTIDLELASRERSPVAADFMRPSERLAVQQVLPEEAIEDVSSASDTESDLVSNFSSARPWADKLGLEPKRVQVMQASLFGRSASEQPTRITPRFGTPTPQQRWGSPRRTVESLGKRSLDIRQSNQPAAEDQSTNQSRSGFAEIAAAKDVPAPPARKYARVTFAESLLHKREGNIIDAGLMFGRSFRVGWGPGVVLVHGGRICGVKEIQASDKSTSASTNPVSSKLHLTKVQIFADQISAEKLRTAKLLNHQAEYTSFEVEEGVPKAIVAEDLRFNHFLSILSANQELFDREERFWTLSHVLFDEVDLALDEEATDVQIQRAEQLLRREHLSLWFQKASEAAVNKDLIKTGLPTLQQAFIHLTGYNVEKAALLAASEKDYKLSLLIAQAGSDVAFRRDLDQQIETWRKYQHGNLISEDVRKIYEVLAGNLGLSKSAGIGPEPNHVVQLTEGLDWKRTFGMWLWYNAFEEWPASRTVGQYERAIHGSDKISRPIPWYREDSISASGLRLWAEPNNDATVKDAVFELLKVMETQEYTLELALGPRGFGPSPYDYRIPWHFYLLLVNTGTRDFARVDEEEGTGYSPVANTIHANMASQLEHLGLWEWAIFVLLHLELPESREKAIKEVLDRNMPLLDEEEEWRVTKRLIDDWLIPENWIYSAKALRARYEQQPYMESKAWLLAGAQNKAHQITITRLAPDAVLREDYRLLERLFDSMDADEIEEWHSGGQIFREFVDIYHTAPKEIEKHRIGQSATPSPDLYSIKVRMQKFLRTLPSLSQHGVMQGSQSRNLRLDVCIAEMAAKVSVWLQRVENWFDENDFISNLPLPEDQRLVRIQAVANSYLTNLLTTAS